MKIVVAYMDLSLFQSVQIKPRRAKEFGPARHQMAVRKGAGGGGKAHFSAAAISYDEANAVVEYKPEAPEETGNAAEDLEQKLKYIQETVPTVPQPVMGSTAGAGSGTFHIYRHGRRREQERLRGLDEEEMKRSAQQQFAQREAERQQWAEARTAKRRKKRLKRKAKRQQQNGNDAGVHQLEQQSDADGDASEPDATRPRLSSGAERAIKARCLGDTSKRAPQQQHHHQSARFEPAGGSLD